jgi:hypothetical protein
MDLRDIQRLHAQFAPDAMTIDLPKQIAALPAPGERDDERAADFAPAVRARWTKAGPLARGGVMAVAVAAVVGMAGMGAAAMYTSMRAGHVAATPSAIAPAKEARVVPPAAPAPSVTKAIDATPARPVDGAPVLSASDFASASSLGLTADQFRASLKNNRVEGQASADAAHSSASNENDTQRAAVSPIHRPGASREATPRLAPTVVPIVSTAIAPTAAPAEAPALAKVDAVAVQPVPQQAVVVSAQASAASRLTQAQAQTQPASTEPTLSLAKPARVARHHVSRPRPEQNADVDTAHEPSAAAAPQSKTGPSSHTGSSEVQMF